MAVLIANDQRVILICTAWEGVAPQTSVAPNHKGPLPETFSIHHYDMVLVWQPSKHAQPPLPRSLRESDLYPYFHAGDMPHAAFHADDEDFESATASRDQRIVRAQLVADEKKRDQDLRKRQEAITKAEEAAARAQLQRRTVRASCLQMRAAVDALVAGAAIWVWWPVDARWYGATVWQLPGVPGADHVVSYVDHSVEDPDRFQSETMAELVWVSKTGKRPPSKEKGKSLQEALDAEIKAEQAATRGDEVPEFTAIQDDAITRAMREENGDWVKVHRLLVEVGTLHPRVKAGDVLDRYKTAKKAAPPENVAEEESAAVSAAVVNIENVAAEGAGRASDASVAGEGETYEDEASVAEEKRAD